MLDPSAGWSCEVAPGAYRLRLELPDGTALERALFAASGTQTQIFLLRRDYVLLDGKVERRADLAGGAVTIFRQPSLGQPGFNRFDLDRRWRAAELARYALTQNRPVLTDAMVTDILNLMFEDPMFGLLGAHLILRDQSRDRPEDAARFADRFRIVTDNLLRLLGPDHPDLRALWLRRTDRGPANLVSAQLRSPPMLRASWELAVEESIRDPGVIASETPCALIADWVVPAAPWLLWRVRPGPQGSLAAPDRPSAIAAALADYLNARARAETGRAQAAPQALQASAPGREGTSSVGPTPTLAPDEKVELARSLGVPGHVIEAMLHRLPR